MKEKMIFDFLKAGFIGRYLALFKAVFSFVVVVAIVAVGVAAWAEVSHVISSVNLYGFCLSLVVWFFLHLISPVITFFIMDSINNTLNLKSLFYIYINRLPLKYLPGGVWNSVSRAADYSSEGLSAKSVMLYFFIENILIVSTSMFLGGAILWFVIEEGVFQFALRFVTLTIVFAVVFLPFMMKAIKNIKVKCNFFSAAILLLGYWGVAGYAFLLFIESFSGFPLSVDRVDVVGVYTLSWSIGYVAIFAPQGVGVTEWVASQLLTSDMPLYLLSLVALFRVIPFITDIVCFSIFKCVEWLLQRSF